MGPIHYTKHEITEQDIEAVSNSLQSGWLTQGPAITEFEHKFVEQVGAKHALAINNGTSALHLAVMGLGLEKGQNVLVTSLSFVASANCVLYQGGRVEFVDIDEETFNVDLQKLYEKIENSKKGDYTGIVVVDFAGLPVDTQLIYDLAKKKNMWVIEDASHAPGAQFRTSGGVISKVGDAKFADVVTFSFHPAKHIACGEGGMVTTQNTEVFKKMKLLRTHGIVKPQEVLKRPWFQDMTHLGHNFRISDINAALGLSQLLRLEESVQKRNEIAVNYSVALSKIEGVKIPKWEDRFTHALHLYVVRVKNRDKLFLHLKKNNVHCQIHYTPIYRMSYYQQFGYNFSDFPHSEKYFDECISLPMYATLSADEQQYVIEKITEFY